MKIFSRFLPVAMCTAIVLLSACSKGPSNNITSSAFDTAPPEVKQLWNEGIAAWKSHRYAEAATNFVSLHAKSASLSPQQMDELTKAMDEFGQAAFAEANKGDKAATDAVLELRNATDRRSGAGR